MNLIRVLFTICLIFHCLLGFGQLNKVKVIAEVTYPKYIINQKIPSILLAESKYKNGIAIIGSNLEKYITIGAQYKLVDRLYFEFKSHINFYWNGIGFKHRIGARELTYERGIHFETGLNYYLFRIKNLLNFAIGVNYTYMRGNHHLGGFFQGVRRGGTSNDDTLVEYQFLRFVEQTYGFRKNYHFVKPHISLEIKLYKGLKFYSTLGYQKGFKTMSIVPGKYRYFNEEYPNGSEWYTFINTSKGSMFSIGFGLMYDFEKIKNNKDESN